MTFKESFLMFCARQAWRALYRKSRAAMYCGTTREAHQINKRMERIRCRWGSFYVGDI